MTQFNLPSGAHIHDLEARPDPDPEDHWDKLEGAYDQYVDICMAQGKDWRRSRSLQQALPSPSRACTYPARPLNGGSLKRALPKTGQWHYEPKYNGWRALVHAPTGTMFNRYGERLTIEREFSAAMALLQQVQFVSQDSVVEWFDCEALERRHGLGQGTLMVFDYMVPGSQEPYLERKAKLRLALSAHDYTQPPQPDRAYVVLAAAPEKLTAEELYCHLKQINCQWRCPFYEGLVAKRIDSFYPVQLRSPTLEFSGWVKHRWAR